MQRLIKRVTTVEEILVDEPVVLSEHEAGAEPSSSDIDRKVEHLSDDQFDAEEDDAGVDHDVERRRCPPCSPRR